MKKFYSILLLGCLILPLATTISLLHFQKKQLKKSIKHRIVEGIDKKELVFFTFSKEEIKTILDWEHSKEFEYKGEMYDVVKLLEKSDSVSYWCWWDNKETELNIQLSQALINSWESNQKQKEQKKQLIDYCKNWISSNANTKNPKSNFQLINKRGPNYIQSYISYISPTLSPPPKFS